MKTQRNVIRIEFAGSFATLYKNQEYICDLNIQDAIVLVENLKLEAEEVEAGFIGGGFGISQ